MKQEGWKGREALNPPGRAEPECECYHYMGDWERGVEVGSNPDCRVHFPIELDDSGVDYGRNCVTPQTCRFAGLCNGTCKLF